MIVKGAYRKGQGRAHLTIYQHDGMFGQRMLGTFNVLTRESIERFIPSMTSNDGSFRYWRVVVNGSHTAWAMRKRGTTMPPTLWELISRDPLPLDFRRARILLEVVGQ